MNEQQSFELVGHDCPMGRYPAPVVPIGQIRGSLLAAYVAEESVELEPVDPTQNFVQHPGSLQHTLHDFDYRTDRLFALSRENVLAYRAERQAQFFIRLLSNPAFAADDPFLRYSLAKVIPQSGVVLPAVRACIQYLQVHSSPLVEPWYLSIRPQIAAILPGVHIPTFAIDFLSEYWPLRDSRSSMHGPAAMIIGLDLSAEQIAILSQEPSRRPLAALDSLFSRLWYSLRSYAESYSARQYAEALRPDSEDMVQGFLLRSMESNLWATYDPARAPFQTFRAARQRRPIRQTHCL